MIWESTKWNWLVKFIMHYFLIIYFWFLAALLNSLNGLINRVIFNYIIPQKILTPGFEDVSIIIPFNN